MFVWSKLSAEKWKDAWEERFHQYGQTNAVISQLAGKPTIRVEVYTRTRKEADAIRKQFGGSIRELKNRNWVAMAEPEPIEIKIRDCLLITSRSKAADLKALRKQHPGRELISIPAELAFGTGDHATTSTCLRFLVDIARDFKKEDRPWQVMDLGTGTGILAIAAVLLGAKKVSACDYDKEAVRVARKNVRAHVLEKQIGVRVMDVMKWQPKADQYDCLLANIFYDVLIESFPVMAKALRPGGTLVVSGVLDEYASDCFKAAEKAGFTFRTLKLKGKWVTAIATISK